ncbi:hypothetical protein OIE43_18905 [Streptomyces pseudovenezuelae]|uniref:hypothetical protein n=1 Tax=Streptomyces pseudovenezuelae TaxID=67350 RepID=UPI002E2FB574|nr:hypothetical protein [Streptomyces pseudovenezuelae]
MTYQPAEPPRQVIATALWDWWTTADPAAPFDPDQAANQIDTYLTGHGYTIRPTVRTAPRATLRETARAAALTAFLALACLAGSVITLATEDWGWFVASIAGACLLGYECTQDLAAHRHNRRQQKRP